jgi:iron complex outermembrane receptor protein
LDVFDGKLSSTLSYYDIKVDNIIRNDPAHANFQIQSGTQVSKGFEAEVIANPITGVNVVAGFAYNDSKYKTLAMMLMACARVLQVLLILLTYG